MTEDRRRKAVNRNGYYQLLKVREEISDGNRNKIVWHEYGRQVGGIRGIRDIIKTGRYDIDISELPEKERSQLEIIAQQK